MQSKSVSEILVKLLEHRPSRLTKELVENLLLHSNRVITPEDCSKIIAIAVNEIEVGERDAEVEVAWSILRCLSQTGADLGPIINVAHIRALAKHAETARDRKKIVQLFIWFAQHGSPAELKKAVGPYLKVFVQCAGGDVDMLSAIVELLARTPQLLPSGPDLLNFCEALVAGLAKVPSVKPEPKLIEPFRSKLATIRAFFEGLLRHSDGRDEILLTCLGVVYNAISKSAVSEECQALTIILHLVDTETIPRAVRTIFEKNPDGLVLKKALELFCKWIVVFPDAGCLKMWILALLDLLEAERKYEVLNNVTESVIGSYFFFLQLPFYRNSVAPVLWRMLFATRHNHSVFRKVAKIIPNVWWKLKGERKTGNDQVLFFLHTYCSCMKNEIPDFDREYYEISRILQESTPRQIQSCSVLESFALWDKDICDEEMTYSLDSDSSHSPLASQVDLESFSGDIATVPRGRAGLVNLGNTCYANSVLQALLMTHKFCFGLLETVTEDRQPLLCKLQTLFTLLLFSKRSAHSPVDVLDACRPANFLPGHQQDSSEFLIHLLNLIREQEKEHSPPSPAKQSTSPNCGPQGGDGGDIADAMSRWTTEEDLSTGSVLERKAVSLADCSKDCENLSGTLSGSEDSGIHSICGGASSDTSSSDGVVGGGGGLVQQTFGGRALTCYRCLACGTESAHSDAFTELQLAFPPEDERDDRELDVQTLLDYYVSTEKLSGDNSYRCDKCGVLTTGTRSVAVLRPPPHLVLVIKHFRYDGASGRHRKLLRRMRYREELRLPVLGGGGGVTRGQPYSLYAAVVHSGRAVDQGHYYTVARERSGRWFFFNDESVGDWSPGALADARSPDTPYVLFYARPGEALQPPAAELALEDLQPRLREAVLRDDRQLYLQRDRKRKVLASSYPYHHHNHHHHRGDDDDDATPGGCGGLDDAPNFIY